MKVTRTELGIVVGFLVTMFVAFDVLAQGAFGNLGFESANLPIVPQGESGGAVPVGVALPGWQAYIGTGQASEIYHNDRSIGGAAISILGPLWNPLSQILEGSYSVFLQPSFSGLDTVAIAQTSQIPQNARSLTFLATPASSLEAAFEGQRIPLVQIGVGADYIMLGGDISGFAGQTGELRFSGVPTGGGIPGGGGILDDIQFSSQSIPEPSTLLLFSLGGLALLVHRFRRE